MELGYKAALYYGDAATYAGSTTWTEITAIEELEPPSIAVDDIETKHLKTADRYKTYVGGWADGGEVTATLQWDITQYTALAALLRTVKGWKVLFSDEGATHAGGVGFEGYIKGIGTPVEIEGKVMFDITIKVTGKPTTIAADSTP